MALFFTYTQGSFTKTPPTTLPPPNTPRAHHEPYPSSLCSSPLSPSPSPCSPLLLLRRFPARSSPHPCPVATLDTVGPPPASRLQSTLLEARPTRGESGGGASLGITLPTWEFMRPRNRHGAGRIRRPARSTIRGTAGTALSMECAGGTRSGAAPNAKWLPAAAALRKHAWVLCVVARRRRLAPSWLGCIDVCGEMPA
jgi:hypothetical protein